MSPLLSLLHSSANTGRGRKPFKEPRNQIPAGGPVRQPYLTYWPASLHRLAESIPWNQFLGSLNVYKYRLRILPANKVEERLKARTGQVSSCLCLTTSEVDWAKATSTCGLQQFYKYQYYYKGKIEVATIVHLWSGFQQSQPVEPRQLPCIQAQSSSWIQTFHQGTSVSFR